MTSDYILSWIGEIGCEKERMYHDLMCWICLRDLLQDEISKDIIGLLMEYVVDAANFMMLKEIICRRDQIEAPRINDANKKELIVSGYGASRSSSRNEVSSARYNPY